MRTALLIACFVFHISGQSRFSRIGDIAPAPQVSAVIQGKLEWPRKGRATVIEFWAASCVPCLSSIPHLNELADEFSNRPIDFLWLNTFESAEIAKQFLKAHAMKGTVATDNNSKTSTAYGIEAIPATVLISRSEIVAAIGHPSQITPAVLQELLSDKRIDLQAVKGLALTSAIPKHHSFLYGKGVPAGDESALTRIAIFPTTVEGGLISSVNQVESSGSTLRDLLAYAYGIPPFRIVIPTPLAEERYSVQGWVPTDSQRLLKSLVQVALNSAAAISVRGEDRMVDAIVVEGLPGKLRHSPSSHVTSRCEDGIMKADGAGLDVLRKCIEQVTGKTVVIPHAPASTYRCEVKWNPSVPGTFESALKDDLGITMRTTRRSAKALIVEPLKNDLDKSSVSEQ